MTSRYAHLGDDDLDRVVRALGPQTARTLPAAAPIPAQPLTDWQSLQAGGRRFEPCPAYPPISAVYDADRRELHTGSATR